MIHKCAFSLFGNVCRLGESSVQRQLVTRQLTVKSFSSHSWFLTIKKLLVKYGLPDPVELLTSPLTNRSTIIALAS